MAKCKACGGTNTDLTSSPVSGAARIYCNDCNCWVGSCDDGCGTKFRITEDPAYTDACCPNSGRTQGAGVWGVYNGSPSWT